MISILNSHKRNYPQKIASLEINRAGKHNKYFSKWNWNDKTFMEIDWSSEIQHIVSKILAATQEDYKYNGPFSFLDGKNGFFEGLK